MQEQCGRAAGAQAAAAGAPETIGTVANTQSRMGSRKPISEAAETARQAAARALLAAGKAKPQRPAHLSSASIEKRKPMDVP